MNYSCTIFDMQSTCRFPKLEECAHFHYERVQLGSLSVRLVDEKSEFLNVRIAPHLFTEDVSLPSIQHQSSAGSHRIIKEKLQSTVVDCSTLKTSSLFDYWFIIKVIPSRSDPFLIKRSFRNLKMLDEILHRCVYDRKISKLTDLGNLELTGDENVEYAVENYLNKFSKIASDSLTCGTVLTWLQLDNKGRRLPLADKDTMKGINTPAVGAAYGVRRYIAQACDEISIEVGDIISVIDMPKPAESIWWRGKSHYEVGFFPQSCVAIIGDKVPRHFPLPAPLVGQLDVSPTKPVLRKHGKLITFFRSFILSRPSRRCLKQSGIYKERIFSCDLSEHLLNSGQEIPIVLKYCAEFIEEYGIVNGIYRLSGITSNIQKLRRAFDEDRAPDLNDNEIRQDIHAVSSLLKMYFRELPNPLCTYQLYDNFVETIQTKTDPNERLRLMKETVLKLPPPHYRTLKYLIKHLHKISKHAANTGMTDKNLAIVWAPNLFRSPALETRGVIALEGVGVQAVITEYLIKNCEQIFDESEEANPKSDYRKSSLTDFKHLPIEQQQHDQSLSSIERPKSLTDTTSKLITLKEAQERNDISEPSTSSNADFHASIISNATSTSTKGSSYAEENEISSNLPDKYHTILPVPKSWQKRKTHSWKSLFSRSLRNANNSDNNIKTVNISPSRRKKSEISNAMPYLAKDNTNDQEESHEVCSNVKTATAQTQNKPKSIDTFDEGLLENYTLSNPAESCLKVGGHLRSVSHNSYFDVLHSPLRSVTACPSRELSELELNFDCEEPEMRIFSESESLISSPKVGKENIPPRRRSLCILPNEYFNVTNDIDISPKKQSKLNLLRHNDPSLSNSMNQMSCGEIHGNECSERYKLEAQLSDIQFIDNSTSENLFSNSGTICTNAEVYSASPTLSSNLNCIKRNELFGSSNSIGQSKYDYSMSPSSTKMNFEYEKGFDLEKSKDEIQYKSGNGKQEKSSNRPISLYMNDTHLRDNSIFKSNLTDMKSDVNQSSETKENRLSITTPLSPIQSPRYSLLLGEVSSEDSSALNTPTNDDEYRNTQIYNTQCYIGNKGETCIKDDFDNVHNCNKNTNLNSAALGDVYYNMASQNSNMGKEKYNLLLNLEERCSKKLMDTVDISPSSNNKLLSLSIPLSSNYVHAFDNTSQSTTPSEFGYHPLHNQSNTVSLENSPRSEGYENFDGTSSNEDKNIIASNFLSDMMPIKPASVKNVKSINPIRATINITYNAKSPIHVSTAESSVKSTTESTEINFPLPVSKSSVCFYPKNRMENTVKHIIQSEFFTKSNFDEKVAYEKMKDYRSCMPEYTWLMNNGKNKYFSSTEKIDAKSASKKSGQGGENETEKLTIELKKQFRRTSKVQSNLEVYQEDIDDAVTQFKDNNRLTLLPLAVFEPTKYSQPNNLKFDEVCVLNDPGSAGNCPPYENVETQLTKVFDSYSIPKTTTIKQFKEDECTFNIEENVLLVHQQNDNRQTSCNDKQINWDPLKVLIETSTALAAPPVHQKVLMNFNYCVPKKEVQLLVIPNPERDILIKMTVLLLFANETRHRETCYYLRSEDFKEKLSKIIEFRSGPDENTLMRDVVQKHYDFITRNQQKSRDSQQIKRRVLDINEELLKFTSKTPYNCISAIFEQIQDPIQEEKLSRKLKPSLEKPTKKRVSSSSLNMSSPTSLAIQNKASCKTDSSSTGNNVPLVQNVIGLKSFHDKVTPSCVTEHKNLSSCYSANYKVLSGLKLDRERIEKIKEERRYQLNEKYRAESPRSKLKVDQREFSKINRISDPLRTKSKSCTDASLFKEELVNSEKNVVPISNISKFPKTDHGEIKKNNCNRLIKGEEEFSLTESKSNTQ